MPDIIGDTVDRLITVEMRNRAMNHGIIRQIYDEARREGVAGRLPRAPLKRWRTASSLAIPC
ncbi:hypothetical protein [Pigmentiphaga litoralis]|uniref:hypothetical protein n=1 Tax=Pigmentiphaga litoralis TaxID=516702 RepID=UPI003B43953A